MVAQYSAGHLTRSLVRIPNSRVDRTATAVIFDLSRVSSLAASVPISHAIPSALQHQSSSCVPVNAKGHAAAPTTSEPPPRASGIQAAVATASGPSPRASGGQAAAATAPSRKRAIKKPITVARSGKRSRPGVPQQVNTASAGDQPPTKKAKVVQKLPGQAGVRTSLPNQVLATSVGNTRSQPTSAGAPPVMVAAHNHLLQPALVMTSHQLLQERDQLRHENLALKQQLSLFHMLFRNKEKLKSVVRTLGIQVR